MIDDASWFADHPAQPHERTLTWAERFRGAMMGGAVGDALGAGVRTRTSWELQHWFGQQGVVDYLPIFGRRGAVTDLSQLTVFTLEALLRAKAVNGGSADWLPTPVVRTNHLRWLFTQGVPWEFAMSGYLQTHPEPSGWLLERQELFSTRNPGGDALAGLGKLAQQPPMNEPGFGSSARPGFADCMVWAAPTMVWSESEQMILAAGADIAKLLTDDRNVHGAAGFHADVLSQLIKGETGLWDAVSRSNDRLASVQQGANAAGAVRRTVHAAMFATREGRRPDPLSLDAEFDTEQAPGELGIALAAVASTQTYADAVLVAVNQSADSSVTAALAGQLAGALYGTDAIPRPWLDALELREVFETLCEDATEAFAPPPPPPPLPRWAQRYVGESQRSLPGPRELGRPAPAGPSTSDWNRPDGNRSAIGQGRPPEEPSGAETTMVIDLSAHDLDFPLDESTVPSSRGRAEPTHATNSEAPRTPEAPSLPARSPASGVPRVQESAQASTTGYDAAPARVTGPATEPIVRPFAEPAPAGRAAAPFSAAAHPYPEPEPDSLPAPEALAEPHAFSGGRFFAEPSAGADQRDSVESRVFGEPRPTGERGAFIDSGSYAPEISQHFAEQEPPTPEPSPDLLEATEEAVEPTPEPWDASAFSDLDRDEAVVEASRSELFVDGPVGPDPLVTDLVDSAGADVASSERPHLDPIDFDSADPRRVEVDAASSEPASPEPASSEPASSEPASSDLASFDSASPELASADPAGPEPVESVQDLPPVSDSLADDIPTADDDADSLSDEPIAASELGESDTDFAEFGTAVIETDVEGTSPAAASATSVSDSTAADRAGVFGSAAAEGSVADGAASDGTGFDGAGFEPAAFEIVDSESTASEVAASDAEDAEVALPETADHDVAGSDVASADVEPVVEPERRRSKPESAPAPKSTGSGGHAKQEGSDYIAPSLTERVLGCFLGGALGDSLGSDLEFVSAEEITERFGPQGPRGLREAYGVRGAITDDTQMTLFTAEGLIRGSVAQRSSGVEDPLPEVQLAYQRWLHTQGVEWESAAGAFHSEHPRPDGWLVEVPGLFATRAPGKTVFRALSRFADGEPSGSFTEVVNDSKGCGGVMRAAPAALYSPNPPVAFELAARTAALTHGHSSGYLPAGAMAVIVQQALLGQSLDDGVWLALQVLETWDGHEETSALLKEAVDLAADGVPTPQQIEETLGGGWVGEQALAIAVCAALAGGDDVELALRVAVHHSGDSDSVGAICGNIVGSLLGVGALPVEWLADLELRGVVEQMALDCVAEFGGDEFTAEPVENRVAVPGSGQPTDEVWHARYPARPLWSDESGADSDERSDRTGGDEPRFAEVVESAPAATFPPAAEQDSSERSADQDVPDRHRSAIEDDRFSSASRQSPAVEEGPAERSPAEQGVVDQESWPVQQSPAPTERIRRSQLKASDAPESSDSDAFGQWAPVAEFPAPKPAPRRINTAGGPTGATPGQRHDS